MIDKKNKILIVDDTKAFVVLLKYYCQQAGYEVIETYNGNDALNILKIENIDLMLLDVNMPDMDGFAVAENVRQNDKTALPEIEYCNKALESGANDFLTKPVNKVHLIEKIKRLLKIKE